ncbi:MAG: hypothetical protein K6E36_05470 [Oscillospiraceae bacterium]|nr:hypothetical protein [Oscillospiraceae bacterium]
MDETANTTHQNEPSGIFDPKPIQTDKLPLTGPQKAIRLLIILSVLVLAGLIWILTRNQFMKPIKAFYRGMSHSEISSMTQAFPQWLANADVPEEMVSVNDMCSTALTEMIMKYGKGAKVSVSLASKTEVGKEYLERIANGIQVQYSQEVRITEGYWVRLHVCYRFNNLQAEETRYARVYKIDGKWRMLDIPSDSQ